MQWYLEAWHLARLDWLEKVSTSLTRYRLSGGTNHALTILSFPIILGSRGSPLPFEISIQLMIGDIYQDRPISMLLYPLILEPRGSLMSTEALIRWVVRRYTLDWVTMLIDLNFISLDPSTISPTILLSLISSLQCTLKDHAFSTSIP